ncbi:hypothetical protein P6144_03775 [Sphingomonas sp. HITSZ_GF]|uniref:hypothetical protein n=1 Tax=Sphingomonas sp. HITSZ_GF TaxID=3037247 RepID=UPI00240DBB3F|nr:hypothetical protein [Sphingomonas sp. HITSZ_GF]MDG2532752.1 hypothetical protein [Sphingomonas sp. HITSZ_GF]
MKGGVMGFGVGWQSIRQLPDLPFFMFRPLYWPRNIRRAFILLLPVSLPTWLVLLVAGIVASVLRACWRPIRYFWNEPHRRRGRY